MIENQIFRPWQSMVKLESTESFYKDSQRSMDSTCLNKLTDLNDHKPINKTTKLVTDADLLKQKLANELKKTDKIKELTRIDQKSNGIQHNQSNKINTPASSSAETRLINSRIAALSSASHLMNLENFSRLGTPINSQIAAAAAAHAALASVNSIAPNSIPLNFILPSSSNLPPIPINNLPEINSNNFQNFNSLTTINQSTNILPQQSNLPALNNSLQTPHQLIPNHPLPIPPTIPSTTIPNSSIPLNTNQWTEMISSVSIQQQQQLNIHQSNLIGTQQCLPSSSLIENSHFPSIITNPSDILMTKKSQSIKKNRIKKFHCDICGQGFANNGQLKGHKRSHTGKKFNLKKNNF